MGLPDLPSRLARSPRRAGGFVRHELYLLGALILLAVAVALPRLLQGRWAAALLGLLALAGAVLGLAGLMLGTQWLLDRARGPGGAGRTVAAVVGILAQFILCGLLGAIAAAALSANHGAGPRAQDAASLGAGLLAGGLGAYLRRRLGPFAFWAAFRRLGVALLASFLLATAGLAAQGPWFVDAGVLAPLAVFVLLEGRRACRGRRS